MILKGRFFTNRIRLTSGGSLACEGEGKEGEGVGWLRKEREVELTDSRGEEGFSEKEERKRKVIKRVFLEERGEEKEKKRQTFARRAADILSTQHPNQQETKKLGKIPLQRFLEFEK